MFHLDISTAVGKEFAASLRRGVIKARARMDVDLQELSIALVNDRTMIRLHDEYMNIAAPTDVLTFPLEQNRADRATAGEVIICLPEARRAAKAHGTRVEDELLLYAVHGMLHLAGYDDQTDADYRRMHKLEDEILTKLGVGGVFAHHSQQPTKSSARQMGRATTRQLKGVRL